MSEYVAFKSGLQASRQMRQRMFETIEQRHAHDFADPKLGKPLYEHLLSAVRESGETQAVEEFQARFLPLLNPVRPRPATENERLDDAAEAGRTAHTRAHRTLLSGLSVAAIALAALLFGFNASKIKAALGLNDAKPSIPAAQAIAPPFETRVVDGAVEATPSERPIAGGSATELELPAPAAVTNPAPAPAGEQEPPT